MSTRFSPLGLSQCAPSMIDAVAYANAYVDGPIFETAVLETFKLWMAALSVGTPPSANRMTKLIDDARRLHNIQVRLADWDTSSIKYADSLPGTIWINPHLVAAAEEMKAPSVLTQLVRIKFLHEFWHQLTPLYVDLCKELALTGVNATPERVGSKKFNASKQPTMGDNGYAWEEFAMGGRLYTESPSTRWAHANTLALEIWMGDRLVRVVLDAQWTTEGKNTQVGGLFVPQNWRHAKTGQPAASKVGPQKRKPAYANGQEGSEPEEPLEESEEEAQYVYSYEAEEHPDSVSDVDGHKS